jgi:hypothetical protein
VSSGLDACYLAPHSPEDPYARKAPTLPTIPFAFRGLSLPLSDWRQLGSLPPPKREDSARGGCALRASMPFPIRSDPKIREDGCCEGCQSDHFARHQAQRERKDAHEQNNPHHVYRDCAAR